MSKSKNKKNNTKFSNLLTPSKIFLGLIACAVICVLVFVVIDCAKDYQYYKCESFDLETSTYSEDGIKTNTQNFLEPYEYYRFKLLDDVNFVLEYKLKSNGTIIKEEGTYKKTDTELRLQYTSFIDELDEVLYKIDGNTLTREQYIINNDADLRGIVKQVFKK